jgi:PAS domain S-box-containing protein
MDHSPSPNKNIPESEDVVRALRISQQRLSEAQRIGHIGHWHYILQSDRAEWSQELFRIYGLAPTDDLSLSAQEVWASFHPDDKESFVKLRNESVQSGKPYSGDFRIIRPDGEVRRVSIEAKPERDEQGTVVAFFGITQDLTERLRNEEELSRHRDDLEELVAERTLELEKKTRELAATITERKEADEAVKGSREQLNELLASSPIGISVVSQASQKRIYTNPHFNEMFAGHEDVSLIGTGFEDTFANPDEAVELRQILITKGHHHSAEVQRKRTDGTLFWCLHSWRPTTFEGEDAYIVWHYDITDRKETEDALRDAKAEAEAANQAKSEFLSSMSHELRTPLNSILGFSQLLDFDSKQSLSTDQKESVDHIKTAGRYLLELIDDVLDLAKVETGRAKYDVEDISVMAIIDECLPAVKLAAESRGIVFSINDAADATHFIQADRRRLKQVLLNLFSNAVKYNQENGTVTVHIKEASDNMLRVAVTDTGVGIPMEQQSELFKPFSRLNAANTEIEGTGIGLVVCKNLIGSMGGNIGVESDEGKGATFWFELPLATDYDVQAVTTAENLSVREADMALSANGTLLYVEDNVANLRLMEGIVSRIEGLKMISAQNGGLGIELAKSENPDIIILDINLPDMNGNDVLGELRNSKITENTPVLALSAAATKVDIEKGLKAGFLRYLTKPFDIAEVVDAIRATLEDGRKTGTT